MTEANWQPDPSGKHEFRYWDGGQWTEYVADAGVQTTDPLPVPAPAPAPEPPPSSMPAAHHGPPREDHHAAPQAGSAAAAGVIPGVSGDLVDGRYTESASDRPGPMRQNDRLLRVRVAEPFMAKQGAMVAYQGGIQFQYQGSGTARFLKKALTGEGLSLMRVEGRGDVFLADAAKKVHLLHLTSSGISINSDSILAFSASLDWNVERVKGGSMAAGGLFNTTLRGSGWVAITTNGDPVVLNTAEAPTFTDTDALVAWSVDLQTSIRSTMSAGALIGRGSGEAMQVAFQGHGFVIVQPAESGAVPPHTH
ncbi:AIM24 family protein [Nocardioides insulae]|uniref:AIM24 family protein n=1 Tax=Nocardioides insulae TaxID=394734 RepID=UPI00040ECFC6|nr:AIM24 family protein [Nocardioides insulae]